MTVRSMTGYGAAVAELPVDGGQQLRYRVELRSVNHRFLDIRSRLGSGLTALEAQFVGRLKERLLRGHVDLTVEPARDEVPRVVKLDQRLAAEAHQSLQALRQSLGMSDEVTLRDVMAVTGVLTTSPVGLEVDDHADLLLAALDRALDALVGMRDVEGEQLRQDLEARFETLRSLGERIGRSAEAAPEARADRLRNRLNALLQPASIDPARLAQEVAVLADKSDVCEELTRVMSHLDQARAELARTPLGRGKKLEFLTQELLREFNTIGSKVGDTVITGWVIDAKCELEKVREQVANLE